MGHVRGRLKEQGVLEVEAGGLQEAVLPGVKLGPVPHVHSGHVLRHPGLSGVAV